MEDKKKKKAKKDYDIFQKNIRFNTKEKKILDKILKEHFNNCFADFVKFPLRNEVDYSTGTVNIVPKKNTSHLKELSKIGTNFNQIARFLNSTKDNLGNISHSKLMNLLNEIGLQLEEIQNKLI